MNVDIETLDSMGFHEAPVAIIVLSNRRIRRINREVEEIFGWSAGEIEDQSIRILYPSNVDYEKTGERWYGWLERRPRYEDERFMRHKSGEIFWARARGRTLTPEDPFRLVVWTFEHLKDRPPASAILTSKERQIARYVVNGQTSKEIGQQLGISHRTVEAHRSAILRKVGVHKTVELAAKIFADR